MLAELKSFFEDNELAHKAADSIKNGRQIGITVMSDGTKSEFIFTKEGGRNVLKAGATTTADISFVMPEAAARELVTKKFTTVGQVGLHIFEKMLSNDPSQKIHAKIHAGFLGLMTGGYLGVLTAGGGEVAKFLATKGLGNMGKLKETISKLRS